MEVESNSTALKFKEQGNAAYKSHDYNKAINCYNKAIKENPSDPSFYSNRALCYFNMGKLHEALEDCQRALSIQPNSGKVLRKKCQICLQLLRF
jgi:import receptor subunit TOM70